MGGSFSTSNSIFIQCDRPFYYAGDIVRGIVCLNCAQSLKSTGITVKVTGYEKTHFTETETHMVQRGNETHKETCHIPRTGRKDFFKIKVPLGQGTGALPAGQHQFGFVFALPANIPGTFSYAKGDIRADVLYKVKACCHTPGVFSSPSLKARQLLTVYHRVQGVTSSIIQSAEAEISFCCCFRRGHASAMIDVDRDRYVAGQHALIRLQADNQSSEQFTAVEVQLVRKLVLQADYAWSRTEQDYFAAQSFPGVPRFTSLRGGLARSIPLALPASLPPTTHGRIISCDYWVEVRLKGGRCVSDLKMKAPLIIHPPQPEALPFFAEPPPEWSPSKVYEPVAIDVPSAPPLPPDAVSPESAFWQKALRLGPNGGQEQEGQPTVHLL